MNTSPAPTPIVVTSLCGYSVSATLWNHDSDSPLVVREVLTECCSAATTGTTEGIACKGCFKLVDENTSGGSWNALDEAARAKSCPVPTSCADHMIWTIDRELGVE